MENGGNAALDLLARAVGIVVERSLSAETFLDRIKNYTGVRIVDRNEDGYYEELYTFDAGDMEFWEWDPNQDGAAEGGVFSPRPYIREPIISPRRLW